MVERSSIWDIRTDLLSSIDFAEAFAYNHANKKRGSGVFSD